jgi:hypothetical protein
MALPKPLRLSLAAVLAALTFAAHGALPDPVQYGVAIERGDVKAVRTWLDEGLPPDYLADRIGTGLMIAAWEGNIELMTLFVSRGANVNRTNANGEQALMFAAWRGHLDATRWLLDRGAQLNRRGLEWTALHYAVFAGHDQVAQLLLERGADINARSTNGSTPLMMAAREGRERLATWLLERGADASVRNDAGEDAFVWAMRNKHPHIAKVVGSPERLAAAARAPESFGPPTRSQPVPARIDDLLAEMRRAAVEGRLTLELQSAYLAAVRDLRKTQAAAAEEARRDAPKALEIRARRGAPGREQAVLVYEGDGARELFRGHPGFPAAAPAPASDAAPASVPADITPQQ